MPLPWVIAGLGVATIAYNIIKGTSDTAEAEKAFARDRALQYEMLNYNSPIEQKKRLIAAGMNPYSFIEGAGNAPVISVHAPVHKMPDMDFSQLIELYAAGVSIESELLDQKIKNLTIDEVVDFAENKLGLSSESLKQAKILTETKERELAIAKSLDSLIAKQLRTPGATKGITKALEFLGKIILKKWK